MADMQFLLDSVRKDKRSNLFMGPVLAVMGLSLAIFIRVDQYEPVLKVLATIGKWILGGGLAALGVHAFIDVFVPPEKDPGIVLLTKTPEKIVWAHVRVTKTNGRHTASALVLGSEDGKQVQVALPLLESEAERALHVVREVSPRATIGFSPDAEAQFRKDPASMRTS